MGPLPSFLLPSEPDPALGVTARAALSQSALSPPSPHPTDRAAPSVPEHQVLLITGLHHDCPSAAMFPPSHGRPLPILGLQLLSQRGTGCLA